jgi:hypothetical protein
MKKEGDLERMVSFNSIEYGTLVIEVDLVAFLSTYFLFRQVQTNYDVIGMSKGKAH